MRFVDLTGKKFGRLTVIGRAYPNDKYNHANWLCKCDCGTEKVIKGDSLTRGNTKSCGCLRFGKSRLPKGVASFRELLRKYKQTAKKRGHIFKLTEEQFRKITQQNCHYCGVKPNNEQKTRTGYHEVHIYNGLDRVDNSKGYTIDNVVPCCIHCNRAKNDFTLQEFKDWIKKVHKRVI